MDTMPGAFPIIRQDQDQDQDQDLAPGLGQGQGYGPDLLLNSTHTKKLRVSRLQKDNLRNWELINFSVILIIYFIDNGFITMIIRYGLLYAILKLDFKLSNMLQMNLDTIVRDQDDIMARDSLNSWLEFFNKNLKWALKLGILVGNLLCMSLSLGLQGQGQGQGQGADADQGAGEDPNMSPGYRYGFCFINIIGEQIPYTGSHKVLILNLVNLLIQFLIYGIKFGEGEAEGEAVGRAFDNPMGGVNGIDSNAMNMGGANGNADYNDSTMGFAHDNAIGSAYGLPNSIDDDGYNYPTTKLFEITIIPPLKFQTIYNKISLHSTTTTTTGGDTSSNIDQYANV